MTSNNKVLGIKLPLKIVTEFKILCLKQNKKSNLLFLQMYLFYNYVSNDKDLSKQCKDIFADSYSDALKILDGN